MIDDLQRVMFDGGAVDGAELLLPPLVARRVTAGRTSLTISASGKVYEGGQLVARARIVRPPVGRTLSRPDPRA